ncbi:MAG TPA: hypothetical protein VFT51_14920 [Bacillales bacterium]|nr:hypothetical protein [Bacillales bacterium]
MFKKYFNQILFYCSTAKELDFDVQDYFPLEKGWFAEYEGTFSSKEEQYPFHCFIENIDQVYQKDSPVSIQSRTYLNEERGVMYEAEAYFSYSDSGVDEQKRVHNRENEVFQFVPSTYIGKYAKGQYANQVFVYQSFQHLSLNGDNLRCLKVRKEFFSGNSMERVEILYLSKGKGVVKYIEVGHKPFKFKLCYQLSKEPVGYRSIQHPTFGRLFLYPKKGLSGQIEIFPNHVVSISIHNGDQSLEDAITEAESRFQTLRSKDQKIRYHIARKLLKRDRHSSDDPIQLGAQDYFTGLSLTGIRFQEDGLIKAFYNDHLLTALIDQDGTLLKLVW